MSRWLGLGAGFLAGGFARYVVVFGLARALGPAFPYGTLAVNLSGCFVIGLVDALAGTRGLLGPEARLLLITGFCGSYTTFSSLILETDLLLQGGLLLRAAANLLVSGGAGFALFRLGALLGGRF